VLVYRDGGNVTAAMRHATDSGLDAVEGLLVRLRTVAGLVEKKRGVFYRGGRAFLHFHEDPAGMFADARLDGEAFARFRVTTDKEQAALFSRIRRLRQD